MIWILVLVFVGSLIVIGASLWLLDDYEWPILGAFFGTLGAVVSGAILIFYSMALAGAPVKAKLLNEAYGTSYTTEELIWGDDIIKEVIQGKRSRLDVTVDQK